MKSLWILQPLCLSFGLSCANNPSPPSTPPEISSSDVDTSVSAPTPNTEMSSRSVDNFPDQDPEGDLAPIFACKEGEVHRRQSGKIVCADPKRDPSGSTITGR